MKYNKTFIIDFNHEETGVNAVWVPPGYRFIRLYYGGCDTYAIDHNNKEIDSDTPEGKQYCNAAQSLAGYISKAYDMNDWRKEYLDVDIDPDTDIILSCCTSWHRRDLDLYHPPDVGVIWVDKSLLNPVDDAEVEAAKFLYSEDKQINFTKNNSMTRDTVNDVNRIIELKPKYAAIPFAAIQWTPETKFHFFEEKLTEWEVGWRKYEDELSTRYAVFASDRAYNLVYGNWVVKQNEPYRIMVLTAEELNNVYDKV